MRSQVASQTCPRHSLLISIFAVSLQILSGFASDPSSSSDKGKTGSPPNSNNKTGLEVVYIILGAGVTVILAVFFFKMWQKKKRAEQHARLLRLFEEDDELEVELGLRD